MVVVEVVVVAAIAAVVVLYLISLRSYQLRSSGLWRPCAACSVNCRRKLDPQKQTQKHCRSTAESSQKLPQKHRRNTQKQAQKQKTALPSKGCSSWQYQAQTCFGITEENSIHRNKRINTRRSTAETIAETPQKHRRNNRRIAAEAAQKQAQKQAQKLLNDIKNSKWQMPNDEFQW